LSSNYIIKKFTLFLQFFLIFFKNICYYLYIGGGQLKFRHELKHKINYADIIVLRQKLRRIANPDNHADKNGTYIVKSLYFDNYMDKALREKIDGVNSREKFRIRYYGTDTDYICLEKKSKINGLCSKEKVRITKDECHRIINGDIGFLSESENNLKNEFYAKMRYQVLRPKCIVTYKRESYVYKSGNVRITIDTDIGGSYSVRDFLNPDLKVCSYVKTCILEVKWDEYLPKIIQDAVMVRNRRSSAFSKYAAVRI